MAPTHAFYNLRAEKFNAESKEIEKKIRAHARIRVALGMLIALLIYFSFSYLSALIPAAILLSIFILFVRKQTFLRIKKENVDYLHTLNTLERDLILTHKSFFPGGERFIDRQHPFSNDLDLFGNGSVFQYINRCSTKIGEDRLAADMQRPAFNKEELQLRQHAIIELSSRIELRQQVWATGKQINDFSFNRSLLMQWLSEKEIVFGKPAYTILRYTLPAITLSVLALTFFNFSFFPALLLLMVIQIAIAGFHAKQFGEFQRKLTSSRDVMKGYSKIIELLASENCKSDLLKKHLAIAVQSFQRLKDFAALVNGLEARMNPIAMQFGNGLFLYDFHAINKLEKWRSQNREQVQGWIDSLAEWDTLLSLATLQYNNPAFCFAEIIESNKLVCSQVGHLLLSPSERVSNDFALGNPASIYLITGANMAGKSTFLRSLGVNFVLGSIGSPVCATTWKMPLIELRTGMRTTDSLQEHQSYFYAELYRLQSIMQELRAGKTLLILLDEILKGTNSTDKQAGSRELLKQLKDMNTLVVLATHDIALGDLAEYYSNQIANACFEGNIQNDKLTFDYQLHAGVAQKANATFLMRKMGIISVEK